MLPSLKNRRITSTNEKSSSSSLSVVASNIDLLLHILLRLPVKSLLVFKTVSKQWLSLISDQYFVRNHCLQHRSTIAGLFFKQDSDENSPDFEFIFPDGNVYSSRGPGSFPFKTLNDTKGINIVRSCNGLSICQRLCDSSTFESTYYVFNPSTMHCKILPPSPFRKHGYNNRINLAFDPIKSPHYQAICIWWKDENNNQMEIYSSETDSWRLWGHSISILNAQSGIFNTSGVYWNGSLHWVNPSTGLSIYFHFDRELIMTMPTPPLPADVTTRRRYIKYFGVYKDHMHLIEIYPDMKGCFNILEMKTDYRGWNIKFRLDLNDFITVPHPDINWNDISAYTFSILKFFDEEEEGESSKLVIQTWNESNIFSYDLKDLSFKKISSGSSWLRHWSRTHLYIPTLARV